MSTTIPLHLNNVHFALTQTEPFSTAEAAKEAAALHAADVQKMQSEYVKDAFNQAVETHTEVKTLKSPQAVSLHTKLIMGSEMKEHTDIAGMQPGLQPLDSVYYHMRMLYNNNAFWTDNLVPVRKIIGEAIRDKGAFGNGWDVVEGSVMHKKINIRGDQKGLSLFFSESPLVHVDNNQSHDIHDIHIARCVQEISNMLPHVNVLHHSVVLSAHTDKGEFTLQLSAAPTTPKGKYLRDLTSDTYNTKAPKYEKGAAKEVLVLNSTGIQHDASAEYPPGTCKTFQMHHASVPMHPVHGVHDVDVLHVALPNLVKCAKSIGEIHFMTQIGKSILKTRPEKSESVAALTAEQHGVHLKNEVKLCAYWDAINEALDEKEKKCLKLAVQRMHEAGLPKLNALGGRIVSVGGNAFPHSESTSKRSLHHVEATVRIKGAMAFPCASLRRDTKSIHVRIDNNWVIENHSACFN